MSFNFIKFVCPVFFNYWTVRCRVKATRRKGHVVPVPCQKHKAINRYVLCALVKDETDLDRLVFLSEDTGVNFWQSDKGNSIEFLGRFVRRDQRNCPWRKHRGIIWWPPCLLGQRIQGSNSDFFWQGYNGNSIEFLGRVVRRDQRKSPWQEHRGHIWWSPCAFDKATDKTDPKNQRNGPVLELHENLTKIR